MTEGDILDMLSRKHDNDVFVPKCKTGPTWMGPQLRILDGWMFKRTWMIFDSRGYEIKVNRSDFLSDRKWPEYLPYCNEFYFVCPKGLIKKEEIESRDVGLMYAYDSGKIITQKRAARREIDEPVGLILHVLMSRVVVMRPDEIWRIKRHAKVMEERASYWQDRALAPDSK